MLVNLELSRRKMAQYFGIVSVDGQELIARTRAILNYSNDSRADLADRAGIKVGAIKNWLDSSKPTIYPHMEEVVALAEAAGIPRRFAERGFEDLLDANLLRGGQPPNVEELADRLRGLAGEIDTVLNRLGRDIGKRDVQRRRGQGPSGPPRQDVA